MDVTEQAGQEVIGYNRHGGFLIRGQRLAHGQRVRPGPDDFVEVVMADALDQKVFGVGGDEPMARVCQGSLCSPVLRYLARCARFGPAGAAHDAQGARHE